MKFTLLVNQKQALELGIKNVNQALVLDLLTGASTWAQPVIVAGEVYYWVARQKIVDELAILNLQADTAYRHLKSLDKLGLIDYKKEGKKDLIKLTDLGKSYYVGNESEKDDSPMSDLNPNNGVKLGFESEKSPKLGFESEKNSDLNPTYKNTNTYQLKAVVQNQPVDNFVTPSTLPNSILRDALASFKNSKGIGLFTVASLTSPRLFVMLNEWAKLGVGVDDLSLVVNQVCARAVDLKSPLYLDGPMKDWLNEKSGKGQKQRETITLPKDDNALEGWARKNGYSKPKQMDTYFDYRQRLRAEVRQRMSGDNARVVG